ncbi:unnamed protein product [Ilex paraguariensis]|uniref:Uncharacterized protein n=1 Tax=Ilex paraguariensis TaxID=185542 RepID=A0ABC8TNX3_9AQUA
MDGMSSNLEKIKIVRVKEDKKMSEVKLKNLGEIEEIEDLFGSQDKGGGGEGDVEAFKMETTRKMGPGNETSMTPMGMFLSYCSLQTL